MLTSIEPFIQTLGEILDVIGVSSIIVGFVIASVQAAFRWFEHEHRKQLFAYYRGKLAKAILIGLEFLVAGDIIRTVAGELTLEGVAALGGVVLIRTVLAYSLEDEITPKKRWPWSRKK